MIDDDVIQAVRAAREAYSRSLGHDLAAIVRDLRDRERASGRRVVSLPAQKAKRGQNGDPEPVRADTG